MSASQVFGSGMSTAGQDFGLSGGLESWPEGRVMTKLILGQHYRIEGQSTVFLALLGIGGTLVLKDLNKSNRYELQGYHPQNGKLAPILYELDTGAILDRAQDCRPDVELDRVWPCGVEIVRIDMSEWCRTK